MANRYHCVSRPPMFACYPTEGYTVVMSDAWMPMREVEGLAPIRSFGFVDYAEILPIDVAEHYSLVPQDDLQRVFYNMFRDHKTDTMWLIDSYRDARPEDMEYLSEHEKWMVKVLQANPGEYPTFEDPVYEGGHH